MAKILFVEDDAATSEVIRLMLRPMGAEVVNRRSIPDILAVVAEEQPDLILMDLRFARPSLNGLEATEILKSTPETQHIPVIILTAIGSAQEEQIAYDLGCDAFLRKPISPAELRDYLAPYLR